ncbi:MAG: hypothetical protein K2W95_25285 [Candidatus Obscuribacterales bacterium]|nr:hypothetical protein [Candidatus Obscuribacterales bacterium]
MSIESYDPTEFSSPEEAAQNQAAMEQEFGKPRQAHPRGEVGSRVNQLHFEQEAAMRDEFGWHGTTRAQLRRKWGLD